MKSICKQLNKKLILLSASVLVFLGTAGSAFAEEAAEAAPEGANSHLAVAGEITIEKVFHDWINWVLAAMLILAVAVTIERIYVLAKHKGNNKKLTDLIVKQLTEQPNNIKPLAEEASKKEYGLEGRVVARTLEGWTFGVESMRKYSDAAMESEGRLLDKRLGILSTLGNNTPFVGLLGTVIGIMKAFGEMAHSADQGPAAMMAGISEALIATAFGLGVAIPCVISFNALSKAVKAKTSRTHEIIDVMLALRASYAGATEQAAAGNGGSVIAPPTGSTVQGQQS